MLRETRKRRTRERLSTNALHGGGSARSSDEGSVMELERRGRLGRWKERGNRKAGGPRSRNKGLAGLVAGWAEKSRMRRESHVRFCGGLGEFPRLPDAANRPQLRGLRDSSGERVGIGWGTSGQV